MSATISSRSSAGSLAPLATYCMGAWPLACASTARSRLRRRSTPARLARLARSPARPGGCAQPTTAAARDGGGGGAASQACCRAHLLGALQQRLQQRGRRLLDAAAAGRQAAQPILQQAVSGGPGGPAGGAASCLPCSSGYTPSPAAAPAAATAGTAPCWSAAADLSIAALPRLLGCFASSRRQMTVAHPASWREARAGTRCRRRPPSAQWVIAAPDALEGLSGERARLMRPPLRQHGRRRAGAAQAIAQQQHRT